ncbi:MAG TPA: SusC/RagA family TonB-linked outer membrane protein [Longimicrobiales bacterium]|nr:SusC/RagA family TonB-linked outer membrane protein [Longimicrobiales bacterium]
MQFHRSLCRTACLAGALALFAGGGLEAQQNTGTVRGRVVAAKTMRPINAVQVSIPGTGRGTITNADGQFLLLNVPAGTHTIRAELIGYSAREQPVTVTAGGTVTADIELSESAIALDELVVTGTAGGQERRAIGNVVTQVRAAEAVESSLIPNVQGLLNARASNVVVMPGTGMVGTGAKIRIRGASSLSLSNDPLIYVDGVRVDNAQATGPTVQAFGSSVISRWNDFNPDDIESIEVIKGPAAATLYGTEAAKGVVHIITKKGRIGTPVWNFSMRQGASWFQDAEERMYVNYWRNPATDEVESLNLVTSERANGIELFSTGHLQNYSLSVSGGSEGVRYYIGGDFDKEQGIEPTNRMRRMSGTANMTIYPHPKVDVQTRMGYVGGRTYLSCEAGCGGITWGSFYSTPANLNENLPATAPPRRGYRSFTREAYYESVDFQDLGRFTGSLQVDYRPTDWFTNRFVFGTDEVREDNQSFTERSPIVQVFSPGQTGGKSVSRRDVSYNTVDYSGTLSFTPFESITTQTSVGAQMYRRFTKFASASGDDFALPGLTAISATAVRSGAETYVENSTIGGYVQQQVGWRDRVFITGALRADDNSAFGENFDLVYYPKLHGTWVVSEEPFFGVDAVSTLRLRAAYGQSGTQPDAFAALRTFAAVSGPGGASTVTPSSPGNPDLGPERSSEFEFGFDAGLFDERIGVEFTGYRGTVSDMILIRDAPPSAGFPGSQYTNLGGFDKWGYELLMRGNVFETSRAALDLTVSFAMNDSKITNLGEGNQSLTEGFGIEHRVGQPVGAWYNHRIVSATYDPNIGVMRQSMMCDNGTGGTVACFGDPSNTNLITAPRVFIGRSLPKYEGSVSPSLTFLERFRLTGMVDFKLDHFKWDHNERVRCSLFNVCRENMYPEEYDPVTIAAYRHGDRFGAEYTQDASFAKLREVSLAYTIPPSFANRLGASRANIVLAARNLHTWTKWEGMEPEAMFLGGGRGGFGSLEQNNIPQLTQFVTTFNISF